VRTDIAMHALGAGGQPHGVADPNIDRGMDPAYCAERIWRAVETDRPEVTIARIERLAVWAKRWLPLRWYTALARRIPVH
jgi:hypothetical protein